jgi:hypothetical protein
MAASSESSTIEPVLIENDLGAAPLERYRMPPAGWEIEVEHRDTLSSFRALTLEGRLVMVERYF